MNTLAVVNQKGGCGKTTIAANLAACMAALGYRVLLVDMDPQGHAAMALGVEPDELDASLYNVLTDHPNDAVPLGQILVERAENLWLAPSDVLLSAIEHQLSGKKGREDRLRECLVEVVPSFDFCIIDSPPNLGLLTINALRAAQLALIPVDMSGLSLRGARRLLETVQVLGTHASHRVRTRVVTTMFDRRTRFGRRMLSDLESEFGDRLCRSSIHRTVKLAEAAREGLPIRELAPYSPAHADFVDLSVELSTDAKLFDAPAPFPPCADFCYYSPEAKEVKLAGDFNNWFPSERHKLRRERDGKWTLKLPLGPGNYQYKFIVDGEWTEDPSNPNKVKGEFGQENSFLVVG